uniref:E2F-associated phosphoprotein n=1 Tax=Caenorhabditis tropicalis TaxID=1561998 RepID=A0A1I7TMS1_9PELO
MDDDYYLGGAVGDEVFDSDDEVSSDDEVKTQLRKLAGIEKEVTKDAFGRRRRRSEFEDDMDDELDRSITEYANEHLGIKPKVVEMEDAPLKKMIKKKEEEPSNPQYDEECRKVDEQWRRDTDEVERKMAALELLPYDVDLTDSEVDPEMPAAVLKNKSGQAIKLVYSCQNGQKFDVENRRQRQKERRMRIAASRLPEKERRETMIRTMVDTFSSNDVESTETPIKNKYDEVAKTTQPLASILKKSSSPKKPKIEEEETKEVKMEVDEIAEEKNPIKRAAMERLKEIEKNDDLLYDDQEDEDNEKWVKEHRKITRGQDVPDGEADGVLSCPGCMVELTRDCQRHEIYKTQYRAMFVTNCQLEGEKMAIEKTGKEKRRQRQKSRKSGGQTSSTAPLLDDSDLYTQVKCSSCGTIVAMMDSDEVYHFFNVLAGYS